MFSKKFLKRFVVLTLFSFTFFVSCSNSPAVRYYPSTNDVETAVGIPGENPQTEKDRMIVENEGQKKTKKKRFPWLAAIVGVGATVAVILLLNKNNKKKVLTVTRGEGVGGAPGVGSYTYSKGEVVDYNYHLQDGYQNLQVTLDNQPAPSSGTIKMDGNHTLSASAEKIQGITGVAARFTVTFGGLNLGIINKIEVDGKIVFQEDIKLNDHCYSLSQRIDKIEKTFTVHRGLGEMTIRHEIMACEKFYGNECDVFEDIKYKLEIIDYTYEGPNPAPPSLSEREFELRLDPWCNQNSKPCNKTKTITISSSR